MAVKTNAAAVGDNTTTNENRRITERINREIDVSIAGSRSFNGRLA